MVLKLDHFPCVSVLDIVNNGMVKHSRSRHYFFRFLTWTTHWPIYSDYIGPDFDGPDYDAPDYNGPDFNGPDFNGPDYAGTP
jgi:hypothetical protein